MIFITPVMSRNPQFVDVTCDELCAALPGYARRDIRKRYENGLWSLWTGLVVQDDCNTSFSFALEHTEEGLLVTALVGEDRGSWLNYLEKWLAEYAATNGFAKIIMWGRPGWSKDARQRGWATERILFSLEVGQ